MEISLFNQILLMNSDQLYLPKFSLSLFISNIFAPGIAPLLELVFFNSASIFNFLLHCWSCSKGVYDSMPTFINSNHFIIIQIIILVFY